MTISNIHQAKTNLSKLIEKVRKGEEVVIAKAGQPIVKLVLFKPHEKKRKPGSCKGKIKISKDFDETPAEIIDSFYNSDL